MKFPTDPYRIMDDKYTKKLHITVKGQYGKATNSYNIVSDQ